MAIRRFTDDVSFQVGKESKDRLRQIQRVLRDHFTSIAEQTLRSLNESLRSAQEAAAADNTDRTARIAKLENDMRLVSELNARATRLVKDVAV